MTFLPSSCHRSNNVAEQPGETVHSIAIIDNRDCTTVAVWISSRVTPLEVLNVNAVVVDIASDPDALEKVRLLTRGRAVMLTEGSTLDGLPVEGEPLTVDNVAGLVSETEAHQQRILAAVHAYAVRPDPKTGRAPKNPRKIVPPTFPSSPSADDYQHDQATPVSRTLATANYVGRAWSAWLLTDDERCKRAVNAPGAPWMMSHDLSDPHVADLPPGFAGRLRTQPLV